MSIVPHQVEALGREVKYVLPTNKDAENSASNLAALFSALDGNMPELGLASYGVSDSTLEEVGVYITDYLIQICSGIMR